MLVVSVDVEVVTIEIYTLFFDGTVTTVNYTGSIVSSIRCV